MTRGQSLALALAAILVGGMSGVFVARVSHRNPAATPVTPEALPAPASAPVEAVPEHKTIPEMLPKLALPDAAGTEHALTEWRGHPLLINFWATWCDPCRREIPLLKSLRHQRAAEGLEVVGIAVDFKDAVQRYARDKGIDYPVLIGEQQGLEAIGAFGMDPLFPFTVFADRQGRIVTVKVGELHEEEARIILDRMKDVDLGRLQLAAARKSIADGIGKLAAQRALSQLPQAGPSAR